jgi:hypothetical protein
MPVWFEPCILECHRSLFSPFSDRHCHHVKPSAQPTVYGDVTAQPWLSTTEKTLFDHVLAMPPPATTRDHNAALCRRVDVFILAILLIQEEAGNFHGQHRTITAAWAPAPVSECRTVVLCYAKFP